MLTTPGLESARGRKAPRLMLLAACAAVLAQCLPWQREAGAQRRPRAQRPATTRQATTRQAWVSDNGDGTYTNPVIYADYSDPDAIRVGDDFYMTSSSFNAAPGLPILHSRDLVNWTIIGHVFQQQVPPDVFAKPQHGNGVWAPAIRHHNGYFYIYYPDPDFGIYMVKARNPAGPWSEPLLIKQAKGWIDPCPFWDDDGQAYLVHAWANSRAGIKSVLHMNRMSADGTRILDEGKMVFDGRVKLPDGRERHPTLEGPKLYKRNGYYYIFAPAGGVTTGWQAVLRSKNIWGPYEDRVVMDQGSTPINGPHQGAWVELKSGEHWFLHFQDRGPYGRILHLQPMSWVNDWPVIGVDKDGDGKGEPVLKYSKPNVGRRYPVRVPQTSDEFDARRQGVQWQWHANFKEEWSSLYARPGSLRLFSVAMPEGAKSLWDVPSLLLQKFPGPAFSATARLDYGGLKAGERAGLLVMGLDYFYLAVERTQTGFSLKKVSCKDAMKGCREEEDEYPNVEGGEGSSVYLKVEVVPEAVCRFYFSRFGKKWTPVSTSFTAREGRWIGAKVGLFSSARAGAGAGGYADFDWFRVEEINW